MKPASLFLTLIACLAMFITGFTVQAARPAAAIAPTATLPPDAAIEPTATPAAMPSSAEPGSITVSGSAQVLVEPDEVVLTLGIETHDTVLGAAKTQNDAVIRKVLDITKAYGIEPKYVKTDYINIEPRYKDLYQNSEFIGYFVRKTVEIRLGDISKFESLYSDLLGAGANYVQGIEFRTTDLRKYRDQARALAVQAAREKAEALAGGAGQAIGRVKMIHEDASSWYGSYSSWWSGSGSMVQNVVQNQGGGNFNPEGTLAPGQISVTASLTVEYEMIQK